MKKSHQILKGVLTGTGSGIIGALCCLGPTTLIIVGIGAFFGITGACFRQFRPEFLLLGFTFLIMATLIYFRKQSLRNCEITPKGKIKFTITAIISMLAVYMILIIFIVPYLQTTFLPHQLVCRI